MAKTQGVMDPEIAFLLNAIDEAYHKTAWHGPNLKAALRGVRVRQAAWRPAPERHCIWEIVIHAAYWKYAVRRRLLNEKRGSFSRPGYNWFSIPENLTEKAFRADLALLANAHRSFREAVASFPPHRLSQSLGTKGSFRHNILGVAFHDVYHAGQILLLKRLWEGRGRSTQR